MNESDGILAGLRVIDCGTYIAGPAAATILSDFGAEVIKIERPPHGDPYRALSFLPGMPASEHNYCWMLDARNKKSLALNLEDEVARKLLHSLVATADIFITNYSPDLTERFEVTYDQLKEIRPDLIYAQVTGYGVDGEDANKPGYDATAYWARSGLTGIIYDLTVQAGSTPCGSGDHPVSLALFGSIMLALYRRQMTGRGASVSTSLMATGAWSNSCQIQAAIVGAAFPAKRTRFTTLNPLVNQYETADGERFLFCCIDAKRDWGRICRAISRSELIDDVRFSTPVARSENNELVVAILDEAIRKRTMIEWKTIFGEEGIIWGPIPGIDRVPHDAQMHANGVFSEIDHPQLGSVATVSSPLNIAGISKQKPRLAPEVGEHSREVLRELGCDNVLIDELIDRGIVKASAET
jgi:crotonobetainyl-CoA:carnitine CoA-transferase CaiB-like acyl-CoA transferase